nr:unnamed protein product [Callosobruchus chinensis]
MSLEDCKLLYINETVRLMKEQRDAFCRVTFDSVLCWPPVKLDSVVVVRCFSELNNIYYDDSQNATRYCFPNGTWARPNYSLCEPLVYSDGEPEVRIYLIGYFLSLITLSVAMAIFVYFKELHCLRNTIHKNLMWSYILTYCCWIMTLLMLYYGSNMSVICNFTVILLHYFHSTTFFWMFVEGLYLYILVVRTLTRENFKLRVYFSIGWGLPMIIMLIWAVAKGVLPFDEESISMCLWFEDHMVDWIYKGPQLIVLLLNVIFLLGIMWVLITKLRTSNSLEMQQYHKAAKALLVLTPLLGITYVVTIYSPGITDERVDVFECARAVLLSTQGFTVALLYCFMNAEVQKSIRHHLENWKTRRSLVRTKGSSATSRTKDWWLRPRTESMRRCTEWTLVNTDDVDVQQEETQSTDSAKRNGDIIHVENQEV